MIPNAFSKKESESAGFFLPDRGGVHSSIVCYAVKMEFLYHGSTTQALLTLEPRKRYTPAGKIDFAAIYASPNPSFAAMHSFPWSSDEGFDITIDSNQMTLVVPSNKAQRLDVPISIYKISVNGFQITEEETTGETWHTTKSARVLEEMKYNSVKDALDALGVSIRFA